MKKKWLSSLLILILAFTATIAFGCGYVYEKETFTATFISRGVVVSAEDYEIGDLIEFPEDPEPYTEGNFEYTFKGWNYTGGEQDDVVSAEDFRMGNNEVVLYAVFTRDYVADTGTFRVIFRDSYTGEIIETQDVPAGGEATEPTPPDHTDEHMTFLRWSSAFDNVTARMEIYAIYGGTPYPVHKHILGEVEEVKVPYHEQLSRHIADLGTGDGIPRAFYFEGWYLDPDFTAPMGENVMPAPASEGAALDLYAKFTIRSFREEGSGLATVSTSGALVYGEQDGAEADKDYLYVSNLDSVDGLVYTYSWTDLDASLGRTTEHYALRDAGIYNIGVIVTANYRDGVLVQSKTLTRRGVKVDKAPLSVIVSIADGNESLTYGDGAPEGELAFSGFQYDDGDDLVDLTYHYARGSAAYEAKRDADKKAVRLGVGSYALTVTVEALKNYEPTIYYRDVDSGEVSLPFNVQKKGVRVVFSVQSNIYGEGFKPALSFEEGYGLAYDETVNPTDGGVLGTPVYTVSVPSGGNYGASQAGVYENGQLIHAGRYSARLTGLNGNQNYNVTLPAAAVSFEIAKRDFEVKVSAKGGIYGDTPEFSYTLENVLDADKENFSVGAWQISNGGGVYSINFAERLIDANDYTVTVLRDRFLDSDNYANYTLTQDSIGIASFAIAKHALRIGVTLPGEKTEKDGTDVFTYTYGAFEGNTPQPEFTFDGFVKNPNGELQTKEVLNGKAAAFDGLGEAYRGNYPAGTYPVTPKGYTSSNYEITFVSSTQVIEKAALTLTVKLPEKSYVYGTTDFGATIEYDGFVKNIWLGRADAETASTVFGTDVPTVVYAVEKGQTGKIVKYHVGSYTAHANIEGKEGTSFGSYEITLVSDTFTVTPKQLSLSSFAVAGFVYGGTPDPALALQGFVFGETIDDLNGYTVRYDGAQNKNGFYTVGTHTATVIWTDLDPDYSVDPISTTFDVSKKPITVTFTPETLTYGDKYTDPDVSTLDMVPGDELSDLGKLIYTVVRTDDGKADKIWRNREESYLNAGNFTLTVTGESQNYTITSVATAFTVKKATLTPTVTFADFVYGEKNAPETYQTLSFMGYKCGDDVKVLNGTDNKPSVTDPTMSAGNHLRVGAYTATIEGVTADNYDIETISGNFRVTSRPVTVTFKETWSTYADEGQKWTKGDHVDGSRWYSVANVLNNEFTFSYKITKDGKDYTIGSEPYFGVGAYTITVNHDDNPDYSVTYEENTESAAKTFRVTPRSFPVNWNGGAIPKSKRNAEWRGVVDQFLSGKTEFQLTGTLKFTEDFIKGSELKKYSVNDESSFNNYFEWDQYQIKLTNNGEAYVVTENFSLDYTGGIILTIASIEVKTPVLTYNGSEQTLELEATPEGEDVKKEDLVITYAQFDSGEYQANGTLQFKDAGPYTIRCRVTTAGDVLFEDSLSFTINPKALTLAAGNLSETYKGSAYDLDAEDYNKNGKNKNFTLGGVVDGMTFDELFDVTVSGKKGTTLLNADTYTVTATLKANVTNYSYAKEGAGHDQFTFTIAPKALTLKDTATAAVTVEYNAADHFKTITKDMVGGLIADDAFTFTVKYGTIEGTYGNAFEIKNVSDSKTVYFEVSAGDNYTAVEGSYEAQITPATLGLTADATDPVTETYKKGTNQFKPILKEMVSGRLGDEDITVKYGADADAYDRETLTLVNVSDSGTVYFKVSAGDNYYEITGSYKVTINPKQLKAELKAGPHAYDGVTHQAGEFVNVLDGEADDDLKLSYSVENGKTIGNADSYTITVSTGNGNYEFADKKNTVTVTIAKATLGLDSDKLPKVNTDYDAGNHFEEITQDMVTGLYKDDSITVSYGTIEGTYGDAFEIKNVSDSRTVYFKVSAGSNYEDVTGSYEVKITPAKLTVESEIARDSEVYEHTDYFNSVKLTDTDVTGVNGETLGSAFKATYRVDDAYLDSVELLNANRYTVYYHIEGANYETAEGQITFEITKAKLEAERKEGTYVYDKETHEAEEYVSVTGQKGDDNLGLSYSVENGKTIKNADSYTITVTTGNDNYEFEDGKDTVTFTIDKKAINKPTAVKTDYTYNREEQTFELQGFDSDTMSVSGNIRTVAGRQTVTVSLKEEGNYKWVETNDSNSFTFEFTIKKLKLNKPSIPEEPYRYNATEQTFTPKDFDANYMTIFNNTGMKVGKYRVVVGLADTDNVEWEDGTQYSIGLQFEIIKGIAPKPAQTTLDLGQIAMFLGISLKDIDLNTLKPGYYWNWDKNDGNIELHSGSSYIAYYNPDPDNYENGTDDITVTFTPRKEKITVYTDQIFEGNFGIDSITVNGSDLDSFRAFGEGGREFSEAEIAYIQEKITVGESAGNQVDFTVGGTYLVLFEMTLAENEYYEIAAETKLEALFKLKSVSVGSMLYTIEDALAAAESGTVTVTAHTSFATADVAKLAGYSVENGNYTVKSGVKLFLPFDGKTGEHATTTSIKQILGNAANEKTHMKLELVLPEGIVLYNDGAITVGGTTTGGNGGNSTGSGQTSGDYAQIRLEKNAGIVNTGDIQAWGFIREETSGNGSFVTMNSGNILMPFIVIEHRGGTKFSGMAFGKGSPFNRLFLQNVTSTLTVNYGATVTGYANLYASSHDNQTAINLIGNKSGYLLQVEKGTYAVAKYDIPTKVTDLKIYGSFTFNAMSMNVAGASISTNNVLFPISWYWNISLFPAAEGGAATVKAPVQGIKLLPGAKLTVGKGVTLNAKSIAVYDKFEDQNYGTNSLYESKPAAVLTVNGTLNATTLGGEITASETGAVLKVTTATIDSYEISSGGRWLQTTYQLKLKLIKDGGVDPNFTVNNAGLYESENGGWKNADTTSEYKINYKYVFVNDDEGGNKEIVNKNPLKYSLQEDVYLANASLEGWVFLGWFSDVSCREEDRIDVVQCVWRKNVTVYGLFEQVNSYVFTYQTNDSGITVAEETILDSDLDGFEPSDAHFAEVGIYEEDATQQKYFDGWYLDQDCRTPYSADAVRAMGFGVNQSVTLYAKWGTKAKLTVKISSVDVTINSVKYSSDTTLYFKANSTISIILTPRDGILGQGSITGATINGATWQGQYTSREGSYSFNMPESEVTVQFSGKAGGSCIIEGTLVTLADGTQKKVEDLLPTDQVLMFNHETGRYEACALWSNVHAGNAAEWLTITYLKFSDGTELGIYYEHALFDKTLNRYVYFNAENPAEYLGHKFVTVQNVNGEYVSGEVTLVGFENREEYVRVFSPVSLFHMNVVTNGLLSMTAWPTNSEGFENYFAFDEDMKYNEEAMQADIEKYGLYTYEDFKDLMTEDLFNALPWKYFKIAVGKAMMTWDDILYTIEWIYTTGQIDLS